jgi:hypothetical protein
MKLEEIEAGIEKHHKQWVDQRLELLIEVMACPNIFDQMHKLSQDCLVKAVRRYGKTPSAMASGVQQAVMAAFQFGLVISDMLREDEKEVVKQ